MSGPAVCLDTDEVEIIKGWIGVVSMCCEERGWTNNPAEVALARKLGEEIGYESRG